MKLSDGSSEKTPAITVPRSWFFALVFVLPLIAQSVVVYATANSAHVLGATTSPGRAVIAFLLSLLFFAIAAGITLLAISMARWVLRIPVADGSSRSQRTAFEIIRLGIALAIVVAAALLVRYYWVRGEYSTMLPVPLFYAVVGSMYLLWSSPRRGKFGRSSASKKASTSRSSSHATSGAVSV